MGVPKLARACLHTYPTCTHPDPRVKTFSDSLIVSSDIGRKSWPTNISMTARPRRTFGASDARVSSQFEQ